MKPSHDIKNVHSSDKHMILTIDGAEKKFEIDAFSETLARGSEEERSAFRVSPSGYGIHWPLFDEDISIDGLLGVVHVREPQRTTA
jgi:hypothetical protein